MTLSAYRTLWVRVVGCACLAGWLAGCSANQLFNEGMSDINAGRFDVGLAKIEDASRKDPDNAFLRTEARMKREYVIHSLLRDADTARAALQFAEARRLYQRALDMDRDNQQAREGLEATRGGEMKQMEIRMAKDLIDQHDLKGAQAQLSRLLSLDPGNLDVKQMLASVTAQIPSPAPVRPKLRLKEDHVDLLEFRDTSLTMIFEALSRTSGINFVLDKDVKGDMKSNLFVRDVSVEAAIDMVLTQHGLEKKFLGENLLMIYPDTLDKRRRYEEQVVKSFHLTNADPKQAMSLLKVMLDTKVLFVDDHSKLVVMRDTPEVVHMAEKLLMSLDLEDSEVMMEVEVVEIQRSKLQELGVKYPTQITLNTITPPVPGSAAAGAIAASASPNLLSNAFKFSASTTSISNLNAAIDLKKEDAEANLLASPRIRARNYEKAKVLIGDRVPVITNAVTPTNLGSSVVTGNVQYIDVGLKFEVEPTIHRDDDVSMKVNLEVSNIVKEVLNDKSGTLAYQIGTRTAATVLRLRDGETQVLAGLISDEDRESSSRVPGLGDLPILGRLFSSQKSDINKKEIVLSITPHVIHHGGRNAASSEIWFGTENTRGLPLIKQNESDRESMQQSNGAAPVSGVTPTAGRDAISAPASPAPAATGVGPKAAVEQPGIPSRNDLLSAADVNGVRIAP